MIPFTLKRATGRQRGATLIEVLVSLLLVAVTMLGLLGLQLRSQTFQKDSIDRRNAALIASDFLERATGNFAGFRAGLYNGLLYVDTLPPPAPPACVNAQICTQAEIVAWDWYNLQRNVNARLPAGVAAVASVAAGGPGAASTRVDVIVGWIDPARTDPALNTGPGSVEPDPLCEGVVADARYRCYIARAYP